MRVHSTSNPLANQESQCHNLVLPALSIIFESFGISDGVGRWEAAPPAVGVGTLGCMLYAHRSPSPHDICKAYIIPSLQGFLLCGAEHQSLSTCLSLLQTLIVGLHNSIIRCSNFPSTRSVGLHVANVAFAVVDVWWWLCNLGMLIRGGRPVAIFANNDRENTKRFGHEQF